MSNTPIKDKSSGRIRALRRVSHPTSEGGWITVEAEHETDRPEGVTVEDALRLEFEVLARVTGQVSSLGPAESKPGPAKPVEPARPVEQPKPQTIVSPQELAVKNITWKGPNSKGGYWCFSNEPEASNLVALLRLAPKKTLEISGSKYMLSGVDDRFVNKWGTSK